MKIGINKFYNELKKNLSDSVFKRTYKINENNSKIIIELYENNSMISFYLPLFNVDKFHVYKKDK